MAKKNKKDFIDVKGLLTNYARHWWWFVISLAICGAAAYVYVKTNPRQSLVRSSILVAQDDATASMLSGLGGLMGADPYVQDEIFVITSHSALAEVSKNLGVNKRHIVRTGFLTKKFNYPSYPVDVYAAEELVDTLSTGIEFSINVNSDGTADIEAKAKKNIIADVSDVELPATLDTEYGQFIVDKTDAYPEGESVETEISFNGYDGAAEDLAEEIHPEIASKKSNVIELSIATENATFGIDVLNEVMRVYNKRGIAERNQRAKQTAAFIDERLSLIAGDLNSAEQDIQDYKENAGIVDVGTEAQISIQMRTELERKLLEKRTQAEIIQMTKQFLAMPENRYELIPTATSGDSVVGSYNNLVMRRMTMLNTAKPGNPTVKQIEQQIDALRGNIVMSLDRTLKNLNVVISDLTAQANLAQGKLGQVPVREREFLNLKRRQEVKQQLYLFLLQRREETSMMIANAVPKGQIIDAAYAMRDPLGLGKVAILLIAILIGLFIPPVILYLKRLLRTKFENRAEAEELIDVPVLGEVCTDHSGEAVVVGSDNTSSVAELFRLIRTNLQFVLSGPDDKVVMMTSSRSGEGKSFVSTNIAASLALMGKKVVLVGFDIRKPQLAAYLGIPASPGLTQYLSNHTVTVEDIIRPYEPQPGLDVIVAGPIPPNPGELLTSSRVNDLIVYLRQHYDYVILDTAPVGMVSDTFHIADYADATIYVMRAKYTTLQDVRFFNGLVENCRFKRPGVIVNGTSTHRGYGYGYGYGYKSK